MKHRIDSSLETQAPRHGIRFLRPTHPPLYTSENHARADPDVVTWHVRVKGLNGKRAPRPQDGKRIHMVSEKSLSRKKPPFLYRNDKHWWVTHPTC